MLTHKTIAEHLGLSVRRLRDVLPEIGCSAKDGLDSIRLTYIGHLREVAAGRSSKDGQLDLVNERARLAKEQADMAARKNAVERGELLPADEVRTEVERCFGACRAKILAAPMKCAPQLVGRDVAEIRAILDREMRSLLQDLAAIDLNDESE